MKDKIKELLRETFLLEKKKKKGDKKKKKKEEKKEIKKVDTYPDIRDAFNKSKRKTTKKPYITQVSVMTAMGIANDKKGVNRGLFSKKVRRWTDQETGVRYQFDEDELAKLRAILDIS